MKSIEVLSPGEKIKNIRKRFKIKQQDITGGEITRNLISIIENNKANLTENVAKILADNINIYCNRNSIDFYITADYLLENVTSQVNKICDNYIEFIEKTDISKMDTIEYSFDEVEVFLKKYNCREKKIIIFSKIGDKFKIIEKYHKAYYFYNKAYENYILNDDKEEFFNLIYKLVSCCIITEKYDQALSLINFTLHEFKELKDSQKYNIIIKEIICYREIKKIDYSLECIKKLEKTFEKYLKNYPDEYINLLKLKSSCLREKNSFLESLDIEKNILKIISINDLQRQFECNTNILEIYNSLKDRRNLQKYSNKLIKLDREFQIPEELKPKVYINIAIATKALNLKEESVVYLKKAKEIAIELNEKIILEKSILILLDMYINEGNYEEVNNIKNLIMELVSKGKIDKNHTIILNLIKYYNKLEEREIIEDILEFLI